MHNLFYMAALSIILLSLFIPIVASATNNSSSINVPYSINVPILDGKWTINTEWSDASECKLSKQNGWVSYVRTKHNSTNLFILIDFVSDQTGSSTDSIATYDYCGFFFDTLNDGGDYPKSDDYILSHYYSSIYASSGLRVYVSQGTELNIEDNNWAEIPETQGFGLERGFSSINDPYDSVRNHRIYEASIPKAFLGANGTVGFYTFVRDANSGSSLIGSLLEFPVDAGGISTRSDAKADLIAPAPKKWGNIVFLDYALPTPITTPAPTSSPSENQILMPSLSDTTLIILIIVIAIAIALIQLTGRRKTKILS